MPAATLLITVPALATPPPAVPDVPVDPPSPSRPRRLRPRAGCSARAFELVLSDGFEHGLGAWPRRVGASSRPAALRCSAGRGLRAKLVAGAPSFVQRRLPRAGSRAELAFDLNPRSFSSSGAWIEIAVIASASGQRLASVDLRSLGGGAQLRLSASTGTGGPWRTRNAASYAGGRPSSSSRSTRTHAALAVDGAELGRLARAPNSPQAAGIALGPWRKGPSASTGYLDIDGVTVREAPAGS